jgi:hypothetical protein
VEEQVPAPDLSILEEVPDNTTITVLDAEGQAQPLATQDAANAIAENDPIWCPQGKAPIPGVDGCTPSFNSLKALLTFMSGNADYQGAGIIYIEEGVYVSGGTNDFNSPDYDLSNIRNADLTVTGGWNPTAGTLTGTSAFRIPLLIGTDTNPWGGSITINNITIDKSEGTSLVLHSVGNIKLTNVNITNAHDNGSGAELNAGGNVDIENSTFVRNQKAGAIVRAAGNVSVANSTFGNPVSGRAQDVGLDIVNGGSVSLAAITANGNREAGVNIEAGGNVNIAGGFFSGTKSFVGTGPSSGFLGYGLQVVTPGAIDLASVKANDNFLWGASLQAGGNVVITDSFFNANTTADPHFIDDTGLLVTSGGSVTLNNVEANDNRLIGATIEAVGDVIINTSRFNNNNGVTLGAGGTPTFHGYGLQVITQGGILMNTVSASNNTLFGARLVAGDDVFVALSNFSNQTSGSAANQTGRGLEVISAGNVFLSSTTLDNNQTFGANIQADGDIFLDLVTATNNGSDGVVAQGSCTTVFLSGGTYSNNGGYGLSVTNAALNQSGSPVFANNGAGDIFEDPGTCVFPSPVPVTIGTGNTGTGSGAIFAVQAGLQQNANLSMSSGRGGSVPGLGSRNLSLNSFMATRTINGGSYLGIFMGQYVYMYSNSGVLYIVAFSPASQSIAMNVP